MNPDTPGYLTTPSTKDKIHIVVIVIDATIVDVFPEEIIEKIKLLQNKTHQKGNLNHFNNINKKNDKGTNTSKKYCRNA